MQQSSVSTEVDFSHMLVAIVVVRYFFFLFVDPEGHTWCLYRLLRSISSRGGCSGCFQFARDRSCHHNKPSHVVTGRFRKRQTSPAAAHQACEGGKGASGYGENVSEIATRNLKGRLSLAGVCRPPAHRPTDRAHKYFSKPTG